MRNLSVGLDKCSDPERIKREILAIKGVVAVVEQEGKEGRNALLQALAKLDSPDTSEITNWGKVYKALQAIQKVAVGLTPEEIDRRADVYRSIMPGVLLTSTALAAHWGRCAALPDRQERAGWQNGPDPLWRIKQKLQEAIKTHPANPQWIGYMPEKATPELKQELAGLRERLADMERNP